MAEEVRQPARLGPDRHGHPRRQLQAYSVKLVRYAYLALFAHIVCVYCFFEFSIRMPLLFESIFEFYRMLVVALSIALWVNIVDFLAQQGRHCMQHSRAW